MAHSGETTRMSKKACDAALPRLREQLVQMQVRLRQFPFKVMLIVAGLEGSGRSEYINTLTGWLDPRGVETFAFMEPSDEERERPFMWRFWRSLPANGCIGIYIGSWYAGALRGNSRRGKRAREDAGDLLKHIGQFEKLLTDNGTLIIKLWLHVSKANQGQHLRALEKNRDTAWRVTPEHWYQHRNYDRLARASRYVLDRTHTPAAPWIVLDIEDERARNLTLTEILIKRFEEHHRMLAAKQSAAPRPKPIPRAVTAAGRRRLGALPLDQELTGREYRDKREKWLGRLHRAVRGAQDAKRSVVFVFEGWDAAGKGGSIRRLVSAIDARAYRVIPVAKPTDEEKAHHYLWRFWRCLPRDGRVTVFDRSWYGRVLVERVEGFARADEWHRAYDEINDFEQQLVGHGAVVVKFWLHIGKDEQLRRFRLRERTPYKRHKINAEDWRNRRKWTAYEAALSDMFALTETPSAPWHLIPANNKQYARLQVLRLACKQIEAALKTKR
jgi:polyphosphate:AMP phosphotransferase